MKNMGTIKDLEKKVHEDVEKSGILKEKRIGEVLAGKNEIIKNSLEKAQKEADSLIAKAKSEAEKESINIVKKAEKEIKSIESSASKNMDKAVSMVISDFKD